MLSSSDFPAPPKFKKEFKKMRRKYKQAFLEDFERKRMMLSSTDFSAPSIIKEEYEKMHQKHEYAFLKDFGSKRMMPHEIWERKFHLMDSLNDDFDDFIGRSVYQFHYGLFRPNRKICGLDLTTEIIWADRDCDNTAYEDLAFPQKDLGVQYLYYEEIVACSFLPKPDNIERFKEMYTKIKSVEEDPPKWVETLMEANDHELVFHSIEYRLGLDLNNKDLWLLYIDYLKTHDIQKLLQTYSKFIRFFLEDVDMIDEYREAVKKYGPVYVPWKNTQDFETYDEHFYEKEKECQSYRRTLPVECPPSLPRFNVENMIRQAFPFHENLMFYIRKNASAEVLHKLYKTCKFFYARFPKTLCYKMTIASSDVPVTIKNLYLEVSSDWLTNTNVNNFFIANVFHFSSNDPLALSKIIPKIYQFSAKFIGIWRQEFSLDDLKFFIGHGNVLALSLSSPENSVGSCLIMEDILQLTPCIKDISFDRIQCTSDTAKKLCEMDFKNKIHHVQLSNLTNDLLDPHDFAKFIMKNCLPDAFVRVEFNFDGKEAFVTNFKEILLVALGSYLEEDNLRVN